jgi:hypothetical protein
MELHIVLYDGDSYDVNSVDQFCEQTCKALGENVPEDTVSNSSVQNNGNSSSYDAGRTTKLLKNRKLLGII